MRYIISGIPPCFGGVAQFIQFLENTLDPEEYIFIYPGHNKRNFRNLILSLHNQDIVLIHPQTIGLRETISLIENNQSIALYVVDNSFFCMQSYNYLPATSIECLQCVNNIGNQDDRCQPFPCSYEVNENIEFLINLKGLANKIKFLVLSNTHTKLLKKHFGEDILCQKVSFLTEELFEISFVSQEETHIYDIVFHAADIDAKGFEYTKQLSTLLPEYKFFIPTSQIIDKSVYCNADTLNCRWHNGLQERVQHAKLILCPSLWSYMPETAFFKSLLSNGSVGIVRNNYGFCHDIDPNAYLALSGDAESDATLIRDYLQNQRYMQLREHGQKYIYDYLRMAYCELAMEFKVIVSYDSLIEKHSHNTSSMSNQFKMKFSENFNKFYTQICHFRDTHHKIVVYGYGTIGKTIQALIPERIIAFVDQTSDRLSDELITGEVYNTENLPNMDYDKIIISVLGREDEIKKYLIEDLKVDKTKIITLKI